MLSGGLLHSHVHRFLDDLVVNILAELHAVLEILVVVGVGTARFNVLVDSVDLRFVSNEALLDLVQTAVDFTLVQLILLSIVLHAVICHLLCEAVFVSENELLNNYQALLLVFEVFSDLIGSCKLIGNVIFHLVYALSHLAKLVFNS